MKLIKGSERPGADLFWLDTPGTPVDFTADIGWTWTVKIEQDNVKTTMSGVTVTPQASPTKDNGSSADVASVRLSFAAGSLDALSVGPCRIHVTGTLNGTRRIGKFDAVVEDE